MKNIIIFGATGTIGAYTALELKNKGYNVVAVGKRKSDNDFFSQFGIAYYSVDIVNASEFEKLPLNIDVIIHLAGTMPAAMCGYHPEVYVDSVLKGTLNVLNYALKVNADKILFSQSRADSNYLMGKTPIPSDIVRKYPLTGDHSIYAICKNASVDLIEHYYYQHNIKRFILRLPTIYAYHPNSFFHVNGVKKPIAYRYIIDKAIKGEDIEIWGDPTKAKEIVYIKDTIQVFEKCIESDLDGGVYNVGRGSATSLEEQIKGIVEVFCQPDKISNIIYRPDKPNAREYVNDISKTMAELGYQPQYDYISQLNDYKKEMQEQRFEKLWGTENSYK